ncbi:hypothetical protein EJ05DRAFT_477544 [Pseudovirgaria hyperparasitica]|uniref:Amidohydrolase-related domain-containing protein n=1 Tax=Pseudovirgaria hyperparasitica TaxID=470096 RepID=A0A6A6W2M6_9PEZI|nr:uncharacterized protein EJ05DRAFT_477544 [Pseudovirgaria hyperparasitica]KAF2756379.1 hypothetical protein EJ05DRAFT_477544 [Pseudovirgaria hyperparasitica]
MQLNRGLTLLASIRLILACGDDPAAGSDVGIAAHRARYSKRSDPATNLTTSSPQVTALDNVRYFNGHGLSAPTTVLISGSSIGLIGTNLGVTPDTHINGTGHVLLPGFFESHAHPGSLEEMKNLTAAGVTTTIGASCQNLTLCAQLRNLPGLTSFITAGLPAVAPGSSNLATPGGVPSVNFINSTAQIPSFMSNNIAAGSELFKLRSQNGGFSQDMQTAIVAEGHKYGRVVMTHATESDSWVRALGSGTDLIHHTITDANISDDQVQQLLGMGVVNVPTLRVHYQGWQAGYYPDANWTMIQSNVRKLYDAGADLLVGTDVHTLTPGALTELWFPFGSSLHEEMELLTEVGLSNADVLRMATKEPARIFGYTDRGQVKTGLRADLLLVEGDPIADIKIINNVRNVWVAGEEYMG